MGGLSLPRYELPSKVGTAKLISLIRAFTKMKQRKMGGA